MFLMTLTRYKPLTQSGCYLPLPWWIFVSDSCLIIHLTASFWYCLKLGIRQGCWISTVASSTYVYFSISWCSLTDRYRPSISCFLVNSLMYSATDFLNCVIISMSFHITFKFLWLPFMDQSFLNYSMYRFLWFSKIINVFYKRNLRSDNLYSHYFLLMKFL